MTKLSPSTGPEKYEWSEDDKARLVKAMETIFPKDAEMITIQDRLRHPHSAVAFERAAKEAADRIDALEAEVTTMQDHITEITSEEHSIPELRQELIDQLEEKRKCYFAVSQYQKANQSLLEKVAALTKDAERLDHIQVTGSTVELVNFGQKPVQHSFRVGGLYKAINFDLRLAIDAAMKESK